MTVLVLLPRPEARLGSLARFAASGALTPILQSEMTAADLSGATGLLTTMQLDQIGMTAFSSELDAFLMRGGRWFFNGHVARPMLARLRPYQPMARQRREDLTLTRLAPHPIFAGIDMQGLEESKGVAGFYGRGHNPMPDGAVAVTGLGPEFIPIDWEFTATGGGRMFCHSGNDLHGLGSGDHYPELLGERVAAWVRGEI